MWTVVINKAVSKKISRIPEPEKTRIKKALKDLETKHDQLDIKPLVGRDAYRLKVGGWRLLMDVFEEEKIFSVYMLASRGDVYKK